MKLKPPGQARDLFTEKNIPELLAHFDVFFSRYWKIHDGKVIIGEMRELTDRACITELRSKMDPSISAEYKFGTCVLKNICDHQKIGRPRLEDITRKSTFNKRGGGDSDGGSNYTKLNEELCTAMDIIIRFDKKGDEPRGPFSGFFKQIHLSPHTDHPTFASRINSALMRYYGKTLFGMIKDIDKEAVDPLRGFCFDEMSKHIKGQSYIGSSDQLFIKGHVQGKRNEVTPK